MGVNHYDHGRSSPFRASAPRRKSVVGQNEERLLAWTAEDQLQGAFGHIHAPQLPTVGGVDEHLAVGDIDAPLPVRRDALAATIGVAASDR